MLRTLWRSPVTPWGILITGVVCIILPALQGRFDGLSTLGVAIVCAAGGVFISRSVEDIPDDHPNAPSDWYHDRAYRGGHNERHGR